MISKVDFLTAAGYATAVTYPSDVIALSYASSRLVVRGNFYVCFELFTELGDVSRGMTVAVLFEIFVEGSTVIATDVLVNTGLVAVAFTEVAVELSTASGVVLFKRKISGKSLNKLFVFTDGTGLGYVNYRSFTGKSFDRIINVVMSLSLFGRSSLFMSAQGAHILGVACNATSSLFNYRGTVFVSLGVNVNLLGNESVAFRTHIGHRTFCRAGGSCINVIACCGVISILSVSLSGNFVSKSRKNGISILEAAKLTVSDRSTGLGASSGSSNFLGYKLVTVRIDFERLSVLDIAANGALFVALALCDTGSCITTRLVVVLTNTCCQSILYRFLITAVVLTSPNDSALVKTISSSTNSAGINHTASNACRLDDVAVIVLELSSKASILVSTSSLVMIVRSGYVSSFGLSTVLTELVGVTVSGTGSSVGLNNPAVLKSSRNYSFLSSLVTDRALLDFKTVLTANGFGSAYEDGVGVSNNRICSISGLSLAANCALLVSIIALFGTGSSLSLNVYCVLVRSLSGVDDTRFSANLTDCRYLTFNLTGSGSNGSSVKHIVIVVCVNSNHRLNFNFLGCYTASGTGVYCLTGIFASRSIYKYRSTPNVIAGSSRTGFGLAASV